MSWVYTRLSAILLVKGLSARYDIPAETRDLTIQLMDKYVSVENFDCEAHMRLCTVTCMVVAAKFLHVHVFEFEVFEEYVNIEDIVAFEYILLATIRFDIEPQCTPTFIVHHLLNIWQFQAYSSRLKRSAEILIGKFWEANESVVYSPVIVAAVGVILAIKRDLPINEVAETIKYFMLFISSYFNGDNFIDDRLLYNHYVISSKENGLCEEILQRCLLTYERICPNLGNRSSPQSVINTQHHEDLLISREPFTSIPLLYLDADVEPDTPGTDSTELSEERSVKKRRV